MTSPTNPNPFDDPQITAYALGELDGDEDVHCVEGQPGTPLAGAIAALREVVARYPVDTDRIYLTGLSMGGYGTWVVGAHHVDLFAGLAATAGAPTPVSGPSGDIIDVCTVARRLVGNR